MLIPCLGVWAVSVVGSRSTFTVGVPGGGRARKRPNVMANRWKILQTEALCAVNLADVKCGCHEENTRMSDYLFLYFLTGLENHAPRMSRCILGWIV